MKSLVVTFVLFLGLGVCHSQSKRPVDWQPADVIYINGNIITVDDLKPAATAVAIKDGKIQVVGSDDEVKTRQGPHTNVIDPGKKTMIPGFVDAHSHVDQVGLQTISANLLPPPDGPVDTIKKLQDVLRAFVDTKTAAEHSSLLDHGIVIGFDFDNSQLKEGKIPTRQDLDHLFKNDDDNKMPVVIIHQSGHLGVYNTVALKAVGYLECKNPPAGGVIECEPDNKTSNGVLEETAHFTALSKIMPQFTDDEQTKMIDSAQQQYIMNGFTTAQDGRQDPSAITHLTKAANANILKIDVVGYPALEMNCPPPDKNTMMPPSDCETLSSLFRDWKKYKNHFRIGGVKLSFDGSPQGKTAFFTQPYFVPPAGKNEDYVGYPAWTGDQTTAWVKFAFKNNWQLLVHTNGDAAIDQLIQAVGAAQKSYPNPSPQDRRTVMIHGQYLRLDQVSKLKELKIFPSLYPMHTYYWGDYHRTSVSGPLRAQNISPTGWLLDNKMIFSIHSDAPVTFPNSMRILDSAVNRTTRCGYELGPKHKLAPMIALKAMTIWPAYQHFEEKTKGSIEVGKVADLVILSDNPLTVDPHMIVNITVVQTIKDGVLIYSRKDTDKQQTSSYTPPPCPINVVAERRSSVAGEGNNKH